MSKKLYLLTSSVLLITLVNTAMAYVIPPPDDPNWDQNDYRIARSVPPTIDGVISPGEWDKAEWIEMDNVYGHATNWPNCYPNDLHDCHWANLWNPETNLIYCVVYGTDESHNFRDTFKSWNMQDDLEIYIDAANKDVRFYNPVDGQHIIMGPTTDGGAWITFPDEAMPGGYAVGVDGDVITYEFALTPYDTYDINDIGNSTIVDLEAGHWLGLDMCMSTADEDNETTFMCEHRYPTSLWNVAENFLDLELVNALDTTVAHVERAADNETYVSPEVTLHWMAGDYAGEHDVYFGTSFEDVNDGSGISDPEYIATLPVESNSIARTVFHPAGELELAQTFYWRVDEVNDACSPYLWKGNIWNFVVDAGQAKYPNPVDGTPDVSWTADGPTLSWTKGLKAVSNDVYFGDSYDAVNDAGKLDSEFVGSQTADSIVRANYHPAGALVMNKTYYWRIDSINDLDDRSPWTGKVWSFTLKDYILLDDFESYGNDTELRAVWKDYSNQAAPKTFCFAFRSSDPAKGAQAMKLNCLNIYPPYYGEVRQTFSSDQDWSPTSASGVKALSLMCHGTATNETDYLYVWLKDSAGLRAVQRLSDPDIIKTEAWQEINLALSDFTSPDAVDLSEIRTIAIGVGPEPPVSSGSGVVPVYIDDVKLYIPRCVPGLGGAGDVSGDCFTDFKDLKYLTKDWGTYTWDVNVIAPVKDPCLWYKFDNDACDASGNGYDGNVVDGTIEYVLDRNDQLNKALLFDGSETYVDVGVDVFTDIADVNGEANEITVSLWYYGEPGVTRTHRHLFFADNVADHPDDPNDTWSWRKLNMYLQPSSNAAHIVVGSDPNDPANYDSLPPKAPMLEDIEGQWTHWAITKDANAGELKVYLNGAFWHSGTGMYYPVHNIAVFWLGAESGREDDPPYELRAFITGKMDDFQIYDYALSQGEVCSLAGMTVGSTYHQPIQLLLAEENINTNIYDDYQIDFKDFAMLATTWLDYVVWP